MKPFRLTAIAAAFLAFATCSVALAQTSVPSYTESATQNIKAGVGVTVLNPSGTAVAPGTLVGYQQIVGMAAATALTVPATATMAIIRVSTQAVRWRGDGTNPTAAVGQPLLVGESMLYTASGLSTLKFIEQAASATLDITYYK